ncbi:MAG: arginine--tRNA ligase [Candidatus Acidiferrum sp.]
MYITLTKRLREALAAHIQAKYGETLGGAVPNIVLERPPKIEMGEAASPVAFELAKRLKKAPRLIAQEIVSGLAPIAGIARLEVAGAGYLNAYFDRAAFWAKETEASDERKDIEDTERKKEKIIVEHTSINPNKAAHIGHVRNAVLGDTFARILKFSGKRVQIQNYIDNTGVQVADVVIGFLQMEKRTPIGVMNLAREPKFDYYCWDLYAKMAQFFAEDKARAEKLRAETLKAIEEGRGEDAEVGQTVGDAIVGLHLQTMARLGIHYELLARESEILHLHFWDAAFEMLKKSGAIQLATSGKMAGCWILPWSDSKKDTTKAGEGDADKDEENSQDKIIVRSNGIVTYVGKDIAYQLWKFGLLEKDFKYAKWKNAPEGDEVWYTTAEGGDDTAPYFAEPAAAVYNVIDARQSYVQEVVAEGLRRLGHTEAADKSIHLSYAFVVLTPRCAAEMGYELSADDAKRPFIDMSGRKGFGVKADDLIDKLEAATQAEVRQRHAGMSADEQKRTAHAIAISALRFFLLKFTRNAVIAFDFKDALSFEGETGPYCQYAVVRIRGIRRKGAESDRESPALAPEGVAAILNGADGNDLWELVLHAGALDYAVDAAIAAQEPAFVAKYAFELAQAFNNFYHKHHILSEEDAQKRAFFLALCGLVETRLVKALDLLGIEAPEKM